MTQNIFKIVSMSGKITACTLMLLGSSAIGEEYAVKRGSREIIPLERITPNNCQPGIIRIKLTRDALQNSRRALRNQRNGVRTGLDALDNLNEQFGVNSYTPTFGALYNSNSRTVSRQAQRHQAWGFDQWYDVKIENGSVRDAVAAFGEIADVEICEPVYRKVRTDNSASEATRAEWIPNDPKFKDQWHYKNSGQTNGKIGADISLPEAWSIERGFEEVIVAVVDGGIQQDHPDLKANLWSGGGYNFVDDMKQITGDSHGTHVAGTVAAVNNNGIGVSGVAGGSGTGDGIRLMSCQIFNATTFGGSHTALIWAADNGATISQNSWGYGDSLVFNQVDLDAIDYFNANGGGDALDKGVAFFSAGNRGLEGTYYPGCYEGAFSVAASDHMDERAEYSNFGTWVDITAPGGDRASKSVLSTSNKSDYVYKDGTSMATPHVSGVAALVISAAYRNGIVLTADQLKEILQKSCDDVFTADIKGKMGAGRLNAAKALNYLRTNYLTNLIPPVELAAEVVNAGNINLTWKKNSDAMDVLIVASKDKIWGTPADGTDYAAGDKIDGGGTVVYFGGETAATHSDLNPGDSVFYRAYSKDGSNYSGYRTTFAVTDHFLELGTTEEPISIDDLKELKIISDFPRYWDKHMVLNASLAAGETKEWNNGAGWGPIGDKQTPFSGSFNGRGHSVDSIFITKNSEHSSFFGLVEGGQIDSLGITNITVNALSYSAGIVGRLNPGTLSNSYATGTVTGGIFTGGIAGLLKEATVTNCYSQVEINGDQYVGGFAGSCYSTDLTNSYSTGSVTAKASSGGFLGMGDATAVAATTCYFDSESAGTTTTKGGNAKGTAEMKTEATFSGWDFGTVWSIADGEYPKLQWQANDPGGVVAIEHVKDVVSSDTFVAIVPNPVSQSAAYVSLFVPESFKGKGTITIFDALGNRVDYQSVTVESASIFKWDLRNDAGQKVSSGSYVAQIDIEKQSGEQKSARVSIGVQK